MEEVIVHRAEGEEYSGMGEKRRERSVEWSSPSIFPLNGFLSPALNLSGSCVEPDRVVMRSREGMEGEGVMRKRKQRWRCEALGR